MYYIKRIQGRRTIYSILPQAKAPDPIRSVKIEKIGLNSQLEENKLEECAMRVRMGLLLEQMAWLQMNSGWKRGRVEWVKSGQWIHYCKMSSVKFAWPCGRDQISPLTHACQSGRETIGNWESNLKQRGGAYSAKKVFKSQSISSNCFRVFEKMFDKSFDNVYRTEETVMHRNRMIWPTSHRQHGQNQNPAFWWRRHSWETNSRMVWLNRWLKSIWMKQKKMDPWNYETIITANSQIKVVSQWGEGTRARNMESIF